MTASFAPERGLLADACRVLVARGLVDGLLGHVSLRVDSERLLVRCRGPRERGLARTEPDDIRLLRLDGTDDGPGDGYHPPNELPLHTEVLRRRADVMAVVHAHPPAVVALDLAGHGFRPILGAFDIPGARLAAGGLPVYPRAVLIRDRAAAGEMADALGDKPVVVLRGHGLTSAAETVETAVLQAISVDRLARLSLRVLAAGGKLADLPDDDLAALPDLGSAFNRDAAWRHELDRLPSPTPHLD
jgi:ribulose-5-phosphate 4-epimerase/fuculose-1-phosphate aldolase